MNEQPLFRVISEDKDKGDMNKRGEVKLREDVETGIEEGGKKEEERRDNVKGEEGTRKEERRRMK